MVKGISRQVIVVHSPDPKLFEQAIFILKDEAVAQGITEEQLLKQARQVLRSGGAGVSKRRLRYYGPVWAAGGAMATGLVWLICSLL